MLFIIDTGQNQIANYQRIISNCELTIDCIVILPSNKIIRCTKWLDN